MGGGGMAPAHSQPVTASRTLGTAAKIWSGWCGMTKILRVKRTESWGPSKIRKDSKKRNQITEWWWVGEQTCTEWWFAKLHTPHPMISVPPTYFWTCPSYPCCWTWPNLLPWNCPIFDSFYLLVRCEITNVAWKNVKAEVSDKTMSFGWTDSLHFCVCPHSLWSRGSLW